MNAINARKQLKYILNTNVLDPYPGTREGNHFYDESEGINLNRGKTFPKGYIFNDERGHEKIHFSKSGWAQEEQRILVHYFAKEKIKYTDDDGEIYENREYASYMQEQIYNALEDNIVLGSGYYLLNIEDDSEPIRELVSPNAAFHLYEVNIPVTVKWKRQYG